MIYILGKLFKMMYSANTIQFKENKDIMSSLQVISESGILTKV